MIVELALALLLPTEASTMPHVRATEPRILALLNSGLTRSETFRDLVATLNASNVIVYIVPKVGRTEMAAYLSHTLVMSADHRYLRIAIDTRGSENRLVRRLAHELQHAVEVAEIPGAGDQESVRRAIAGLGDSFRCQGRCYETRKAIEIERIVERQLKQSGSKRPAQTTP